MSPIALPLQELKPALTGFGKVINRHQPLPVLNHIKVERTKDGWIALTVCDLDTFATVRLEQPVDGEPISFLIPLEDLQKVAKSCGKTDEILISSGEEASEASVTLQYPVGQGKMTTKVATLPVAEFPELPKFKGDSIPLPETLRSSLHQALHCASEDETRLILNGAYIDVSDPKGHYVVGTDGNHLFASNSFNLPLKDSIILPTHRFLGFKDFNHDGEWQLKVGEKEKDEDTPPVQITSRRWRFITRQHDGRYPNWRQVLPDRFSTSLQFDPQLVDGIIQTIERLPDHDVVNHTVGIEIRGKKVNLLCKADKEANWTPVELKEVKIQGNDLTIYLNRTRLVKALKFGLLRVDLQDPRSPARFHHEGRQMIVMPLRVDADPISPAPPANAEPPQPAASTTAAQPKEEQPMPEPQGTTQPVTLDAQLDLCIDDIETLRESLQEDLISLNSLRAKLKIIQREHKASTKELQAVRQTLKSLQGVKL